ncbi:hypothetical protein [uncultured Pseudodesulfovibrio sp.]|uniref:hypothetical protein n=1 Tax=uncultured Pseudodesulfovibrio sp. TaxID=2035858 RepID=UPI0029C933D6|nr:hypothetical protein [uncultured Pseudodesulfovibrio sp.]
MSEFYHFLALLIIASPVWMALWMIVGAWWFGQVVDHVDPLKGRHIFFGGPFLWLLFIICIVWIFLYEPFLRLSAKINAWSVAPVERVVQDYRDREGL